MPRSSGGSAPPPTAPSLLPPTPGGSSNPSPTPALVSTRALFLRRFPSVDAPLGFEPRARRPAETLPPPVSPSSPTARAPASSRLDPSTTPAFLRFHSQSHSRSAG